MDSLSSFLNHESNESDESDESEGEPPWGLTFSLGEDDCSTVDDTNWVGTVVGWILAANVVVIPMYRLGMYTYAEYLETRFGLATRMISALFQAQYRTMVLGITPEWIRSCTAGPLSPMKLRENQTFLSLCYEPSAVEIAAGEAGSFGSAELWKRETKRLG